MADFDFDVLVIGPVPAAMSRRSAPRSSASDRLRRGARDTGRNLPQCRLHSVQGDAARVGILRAAANGSFAKLGIKVKPELDLDTMRQRKDAVNQLTGGIEFLFKKNKVEWLKDYATFTGANSVKVGDRTVTAKNIVIATGSSVTQLPASRSTRRSWSTAPARSSSPRCRAYGGNRRRRDRAGAWLGLAAAGAKVPASNSSTRSFPASTAKSARRPTRS